MYLVELEKGVWLAEWEGDPGRTLDIENAKQFKTGKGARISLTLARQYRPFKGAVVRLANER